MNTAQDAHQHVGCKALSTSLCNRNSQGSRKLSGHRRVCLLLQQCRVVEVKAALEDPDSVFFKIKAKENTLGLLCRVQYTGTLFGEVGMGDSLGPSSHGVAPTRYHYYIHYVLRVWGGGVQHRIVSYSPHSTHPLVSLEM